MEQQRKIQKMIDEQKYTTEDEIDDMTIREEYAYIHELEATLLLQTHILRGQKLQIAGYQKINNMRKRDTRKRDRIIKQLKNEIKNKDSRIEMLKYELDNFK